MKNIAINACRKLAQQIAWDNCEHLRTLADKIEHRWSIQGCTSALVDTHMAKRRAYLQELKTKLDAKYPDRMSYLHR
jgi:hypothetical protein